MFNDYYQDVNNLIGLDIDAFNLNCPGVYDSVFKNCQGKNTNCCLSTCDNICDVPESDCSSTWKDICNDNCNDIMNQITPPTKQDDKKVFSIYCDCKKQFCKSGDCELDEAGKVTDCCDNQQADCHEYVDSRTKCDCDNLPQSKSEPELPSVIKNKGGFFDNLTQFKIGIIIGVIIIIMIIIWILTK